MTNIRLSELHPVGSELFQDSESFLNELNTEELGEILGGGSIVTHVTQFSVSKGHITKSVGVSGVYKLTSKASISGANISYGNNISVIKTLLS
ncbi:hypothetical protein Sta7437_2210 [Stanieria cyanosphaera PCC 7437]|uniref:Uncharacterized protein n=1 Tax=Stanieria cyanosphaera (strain ATCC 29371 / PCC 7437) TaxID=111780 RepID=K9XT97_STAC7|nr:hypothetical protein [Stanieria cyanosphaera]AFZ35758.1 hypothetical protein Sta7437_2210 [Stanieria cyanosphaera PCC 7437]